MKKLEKNWKNWNQKYEKVGKKLENNKKKLKNM